jgi:hypothetical protein
MVNCEEETADVDNMNTPRSLRSVVVVDVEKAVDDVNVVESAVDELAVVLFMGTVCGVVVDGVEEVLSVVESAVLNGDVVVDFLVVEIPATFNSVYNT